MKKQNKNDNASNRKSYVGKVFNIGEKARKNEILKSLNPEWARLHKMDIYTFMTIRCIWITYNCLTF